MAILPSYCADILYLRDYTVQTSFLGCILYLFVKFQRARNIEHPLLMVQDYRTSCY